jgi:FtsP/CotA-like multicopper oxidase with cupredoxin domain
MSSMTHNSVGVTAKSCAPVANAAMRRQCQASLLGEKYSMMSMGVHDFGGGSSRHKPMISLDSLTGPTTTPAFNLTLTAATGTQVIGGVTRQVMAFNGVTPGPTITVTQGDLVSVTLENKDVTAGVTIHWHGIDLPGREDGVAGVTQNAVLPGESYTYRFIVPDAGTYWYHSHQYSVEEVGLGLLGAIVVLPKADATSTTTASTAKDVVALVHTYGQTTTINGQADATVVPVSINSKARVRFVNGDNGPTLVSASVPFQVLAIDGTDIPGGSDLTDTFVIIPAGGRADLLVGVATSGVRVGMIGGPSLVLSPTGSTEAPTIGARKQFDALSYGTPGTSAKAYKAFGKVQRRFNYQIGTANGYLDGISGNWFTINGKIIPKVPMFMVHLGDVVVFHIVNNTNMPHPMHIHGHHGLVVSRNGKVSTGAPWWVDSLEVGPRESYDIILRADNPGVWMFHCHNLLHARAGLMTHMVYDNVMTPYFVGKVNEKLTNQFE